MRLLSAALGRLVISGSNRKFTAMRDAAVRLRLVEPGAEVALERANAAFVWSYYRRLVRLWRRRGRGRLVATVNPLGEDHLADALKQGRGLILLSLHLGDFDLAGAWMAARHGVKPVVISRAIWPHWRGRLFSLVRRRSGVILRDADRTDFVQLTRDLEMGRAVVMMLDRLPPGRTEPARLLGEPAVIPAIAAFLAARTGAPLLPAATWRDRRGQPTVWFGEPTTVTDARHGVTRIAEAAEQLGTLITEHPEQWHVPADLSEMSSSPLREMEPIEPFRSRSALTSRYWAHSRR